MKNVRNMTKIIIIMFTDHTHYERQFTKNENVPCMSIMKNMFPV